MAQTLLLGLGGTGSRVVNNVVKELHKNALEINNGQMCCAVLDTNVSDYEDIIATNTGVPVFGTSRPQKIRDYLRDYHHLQMDEWCPQSPPFLEQSMIDGASELRVKSRIAFMDFMESGEITQLELLINDVLRNNSGSKIRIMIVSSLSGGTGSGMFIQVALWLRKFLSESQITIRGIFLLPDVFVSTVKDIRDNKKTQVRHYCNAYAAIRELNTITKIMKENSVDLPEEISIGDLFNSRTDADSGVPVFDFAFFVDDRDENGVRLENITEYEQMVAQLVYMQLYAPMKDDMYSEEDNAFLSFLETEEPLYGSCGTAKAVYPVTSVKEYCALRAAQDSLTGGWKKIDDEIAAMIKEKEEEEQDGIFSSEAIDTRAQFIRLFDEKTAVNPEEAGSDRFFLSIAKDAKEDVKTRKEDGKVTVKHVDKVAEFVKRLKTQKIDPIITRHGGTEEYAIDADAFVSAVHKKSTLVERIQSDRSGLEDVLHTFDSRVEEFANGIVNSVFPYSMGEVRVSNNTSIYGLLAKPNDKGEWNFIHPVAARYVLYKLVNALEKGIKGIALDASREDALSGGEIGAQFDNTATPETETSPEGFLVSKKWYQREDNFLDDFERRYAQFITTKIALCEKYEKERLMVSVYQKLIKRINALIKQLEAFFNNLGDVQQELTARLSQNVGETNGVVGKTMFVLGGQDDKEGIYQSLNFELDRSNFRVNKSVIDAIYGRCCAEARPSNAENAAYADIGVIAAFLAETVSGFLAKIDSDQENSKKVNLDIFAALCRESDAAHAKKEEEKKKREMAEGRGFNKPNQLSNVDIATGTVKVDESDRTRHEGAFRDCKDRLHRMAAPFLIHEKEVSDNELGTITTRTKTFWGFSPALVNGRPFIGTALGVNADIQMDDAYPQNELYCYRAVYGMEAVYIPKFNELRGGDYYTCYSAVVNGMVKDAEGRQGGRAFVRTPHLDMRWHKILPYITAGKQEQAELEFFHGFWLAIAYGLIKADKDGNMFIRRKVDGGHGNSIDDDIPVLYKGKPVGKTNVGRLIEVLQGDKVFTGTDIPQLEQRFADELEEMVTYVGTDVLKGLTTKKDELNPINIVTRYNEGLGRKKNISAALISALEKIASELAERYNTERSKEKLDKAKYKICKMIYDSSKRTKGKAKIFSKWEAAFGIAETEETEE